MSAAGAGTTGWVVWGVWVVGLLLTAAVWPVAANDRVVLQIRVVDQANGQPIADADVTVSGDMVRTGRDGLARFSVRTHQDDLAVLVDAQHFFIRKTRLSVADEALQNTIELYRLEEISFILGFDPPQAHGEVTVAGQTFPIRAGRAQVSINLNRMRLERTISGDSGPISARIKADGFKEKTQSIIDTSFIEAHRKTGGPDDYRKDPFVYDLHRNRIKLEPIAQTQSLQLSIELQDARAGNTVREPARVRVVGFDQQTTDTGQAIFTLRRADLERFRDHHADRLEIEVTAREFRDGRLELPIEGLLDTLKRNQTRLTETIALVPAPSHPAMALQVLPPAQTAAAGTAIARQYRLANRGNVALETIEIDDPHCRPPNRIAGDINGNGQLDVGEIWWFECAGVAHRSYSDTIQARARTMAGRALRATAALSLTVDECASGQSVMPGLTGLNITTAIDVLEQLGMPPPLIASAETDNSPADTVIDQQPRPEDCLDPQTTSIVLTIASPVVGPEPVQTGPLAAELECADGLEITAGARPSRTCWLAVRNWALSDERVQVAVSLPSGTELDVWPMKDSAWPPNMHNPGVADLRFKERYIFTLFFSAPATATPGIVPVNITVRQTGHGTVNLDLDVNILPVGRMPSQGSGIRPPVEMAEGTGGFCVWRYKAFGDPPPCFLFNIAECGTAAYDDNARYQRVGQNMTKLEASVLMSRLSRYGGDAYGCLAALDTPQQRTCPDGSTVTGDQPCPPQLRPEPEPDPDPDPDPDPEPEPQQTCPDGSVIEAGQSCPEPDEQSGLDCSDYGPQAELYWDDSAQEYLCRCRPGYLFHSSDRCVPDEDVGQCLDYPGTFPKDGICQCPNADEYWSQSLGRCAGLDEFPEAEVTDCSAWPGTLPLPDPASGDLICTCPMGAEWSDDLQRCATAAEREVADTDCSHRPGTVPRMDYFDNRVVCTCPDQDATWDADAGSCVAGGGPGGGAPPVGDDPDPPVPEDVQVGQCNDQAKSGHDDPVRVEIPVAGEPSVELVYQTYGIKDRVRAFIDGQLAFDSGCVGTGGSVSEQINLPGSARTLVIDVYPNCEGTTGTDWNFTVKCGDPTP